MTETTLKRTYLIPYELDVDIKTLAATDGIRPNKFVIDALQAYIKARRKK